ncbi:hypothetical protein FVE85_0710 [Porphyridium purpureum]|uniref:Uncharacterized protein n=1 Tax=Porphyridium purpureum TaxID=35688 RepID=A0A5J4YZB2_PORPP|nr:hypothetical protein FVE85_0710 [Porphyridium purpureum]|eukprot:POR3679..scf208_2
MDRHWRHVRHNVHICASISIQRGQTKHLRVQLRRRRRLLSIHPNHVQSASDAEVESLLYDSTRFVAKETDHSCRLAVRAAVRAPRRPQSTHKRHPSRTQPCPWAKSQTLLGICRAGTLPSLSAYRLIEVRRAGNRYVRLAG